MRSSVFLALALALPALAFPASWLSGDLNPHEMAKVRKGLAAMSADPTLVREVRELYIKQKREAAEWHRAGKRDIARSLLSGTIDVILGPSNGVLTNITDTFPSTVTGSQLFPQSGYPFQPPGPTDQRGPCPGMNVLANHGYLPRNGIVTASQVIAATATVFNMGADLAAVLVAGAVAENGNIPTATFSIGGADGRTNSLGAIGGLLGTETGLDGHGRVNEGDASATRCDFYVCAGDNHNMQPALFQQMLSQAQQHGNQFTVAAQAAHFHNRYADSRARNPNFYFVPPSAFIVMGATYFHTGFFTNGTIGAGGVANTASIASFNGAHFNSDGSVVYVPEQIPPQGWYRRATPMFVAEAAAGILAIYTTPAPVELGANAGSTSRFVPGPGLLPTNASDVNGLGCLLYNFLYADFFSEFQNILFAGEAVVNDVLGLLAPAQSDFIGCSPNYPDATESNTYAGQVLASMSGMPGAPQQAPCLLSAGSGQCLTNTNTYPGGVNTVANRWEYMGYADATSNPAPTT